MLHLFQLLKLAERTYSQYPGVRNGYGKSTGTGMGTEDGKYFKLKYGYGDGYGLILCPEVRKEYRLKLLLEFKYGTEMGTEKF